MQITRETSNSNLILAVEQERIRIGAQWYTGNLIVTADEIVSDWAPVDPACVTLADLAPALALEPELVIIGAGNEPATPDIDLMAELGARAIGLEFMQTAAACRTFNVLVHERRRVAAALILG
jgi:uncharacterized protein